MFLTIPRPQKSNLATPQSWRIGLKKHNNGSIQRRASRFDTPIRQTNSRLICGGRECLHISHNPAPAEKQSCNASKLAHQLEEAQRRFYPAPCNLI